MAVLASRILSPSEGTSTATRLKASSCNLLVFSVGPLDQPSPFNRSSLSHQETVPSIVVSVSLACGRDGAVIFVGMDTPELPWVEVLAARQSAEKDGKAYICPGAVATAMSPFCKIDHNFPLKVYINSPFR